MMILRPGDLGDGSRSMRVPPKGYLPFAGVEWMPVFFTVLASGSAGNASLIECDGSYLLLDMGLGPRQLALRLHAAGVSWTNIAAVILTHTHTDHWRETTVQELARQRIPLYCQAGHNRALVRESGGFRQLLASGLVRPYVEGACFSPVQGVECWPIPLPHDGGPTFGFRLVFPAADAEQHTSLAYLADLGSWDDDLIRRTGEVDLLALEFNHDVDMLLTSGRSTHLIERILGKHGHLSNDQAREFVQECLRISRPGKLKQLVQLHLSQECNLPDLAAAAARAVLQQAAPTASFWTASQEKVSPRFCLRRDSLPANDQPVRPSRAHAQQHVTQPLLPGLDLDA
jgi:phosphoribosyl 1,2-cyclic phosphodiesterase